jgi:hypothetical protein
MKKTVLVVILVVLAVITLMSCKHNNNIPLTASDIAGPASPTNTPLSTATRTPTITRTSTTGPSPTITETGTLGPSPTITTTSTTVIVAVPTWTGLLDDCDDGDNANKVPAPNGPGFWYTYDDQDNAGTSYVVPMSDKWAGNHGMATVPFYMQQPGFDGVCCDTTYGYAAWMTGTVTSTYTYGFVGMGNSFINPKGPVDLMCGGAAIGVTFWTKGDGRNYKMKFGSSNPMFLAGVSDNYYEATFNAPTTWTQITVPFTSMTQEPYWGTVLPVTSVADSLTLATSIQWQSFGADVIGNNASVSLAVDQIIFY